MAMLQRSSPTFTILPQNVSLLLCASHHNLQVCHGDMTHSEREWYGQADRGPIALVWRDNVEGYPVHSDSAQRA